jgi:UDP:flavonoid glycosyltransferase YjiC (YdhE family)
VHNDAVHLVIVAAGTRGDVAPYTGLGVRLQEAGHRVTIGAHAPFRDLVTAAGLTFHEVPGDVAEVLRVPSPDRPPSPFFLNRRVRQLERYLTDVADGVVEATSDAEAVLVTGAVPFAYAAAQARGVPSLGVFLQPFEPSRAYPSPMTNTARSLGPWANRAVGTALLDMLLPFTKAANRIRERLGSPPQGARATRRAQAAARWPVLHGISPAVLPRPADWRPGLDVTGYWWPYDPPDWTPPQHLVDFLAAGPPPVLIGFGSMANGSGPWLQDAVLGAIGATGVRAVVQAGWAGLDAGQDEQVLTIGEVPHSWLLPQVAAVVHHGGAGTTAAGIRAGVPAVLTPIYADQPLWARRLTDLGVATTVPFRKLTADRLAAALTDLLRGSGYRDRARALAARVATEDGAAAVVAAVDRLAAG